MCPGGVWGKLMGELGIGEAFTWKWWGNVRCQRGSRGKTGIGHTGHRQEKLCVCVRHLRGYRAVCSAQTSLESGKLESIYLKRRIRRFGILEDVPHLSLNGLIMVLLTT